MPNKTIPEKHSVIPNTMSEDGDISESKNEISNIQNILKDQVVLTDSYSSSETSDAEDKLQQDVSKSKSKKKKIMNRIKKFLISSKPTFIRGLSQPSIDSESEPID